VRHSAKIRETHAETMACDKQVFLMEAIWTRFIPAIKKALELIKSGAIGDIVHINDMCIGVSDHFKRA
jgi:predicted dehydrogenase